MVLDYLSAKIMALYAIAAKDIKKTQIVQLDYRDDEVLNKLLSGMMIDSAGLVLNILDLVRRNEAKMKELKAN